METSPTYDPGGTPHLPPLPDDADQFLARLAAWQHALGLPDGATITELRRGAQQLRVQLPSAHDWRWQRDP